MSNTIPKTIFQTWKSKTVIPENMAYWQTTWRKYNPTYQFVLWDDADNRRFIETYYPWFLDRYDNYDVMIKRADAIRYFYLYHYGGVYVDMDFECLKSFDDILAMGDADVNSNTNTDTSDIIFGRMGDEVKYDHEHNIPNAIMISKPRQTFWLCMFYCLLKANPNGSVEYTTGPVVLKQAIEIYNRITNENIKLSELVWYNMLKNVLSPELLPLDDNKVSKIKILPGDYFYPLNWRDWEHQQALRHPVTERNEIYDREKVTTLFPNSYAVTYWTHSY